MTCRRCCAGPTPGRSDIAGPDTAGATVADAGGRPRSQYARGVGYGVAAYVIWGLVPLYWPLLKPADAVEVLAHRVVWSLAFLALLNTVLRRWRDVGTVYRDRRAALLLLAASLLVSVNWGTYIWAVNNGHVVESSLGYFINPLVSVGLGVLVLGERLRPLQWTAVAIAVVAVLVLTAGFGRPPWIALVLAFSFGCYGLVKKLAGVDAVASLTVETSYLLLPAAAFLAVWTSTGHAHFGTVSWWHTLAMATSGVVTALPLLAFGAAAIRIPLSLLGLLQYIAPLLQFGLGVVVFQEEMSATRWWGFAFVWCALLLFSYDALRAAREARTTRADTLEVSEPV